MKSVPKLLGGWILIALIALASILAAAVAYVFASLVSGELVFDLVVAGGAAWGVSYSLSRAVARQVSSAPPGAWAARVATLLLVAMAAALALPTLAARYLPRAYGAGDTVVPLLAEHGFALTTAEPGGSTEDLQVLKPVLDGRRVVALGEATHGTHEFFAMKHRLLAFLVCEMGFEHFGMETGADVGRVLNDYIAGQGVDAQSVLYWPWQTAEVLGMLDWLRAYNADPRTTRPVTFHGIDPRAEERDRGMAENVAWILEDSGPDSKIVVWAHNAHISAAPGRMGAYLKQQFGDEAYLMGFELNRGRFTSRMMTVHTYTVYPAPPSYYAHALAQVGEPILLLDFRTMAVSPELQAWLAADQRSHHFQELHAIFRLIPAWQRVDTSWLALYDGVIYIEESTPALDPPGHSGP